MATQWPAVWKESREDPFVDLRPKRRVGRLRHDYGLEDILPEEEFKKAMQHYAKLDAYELPEEIWEKIMKGVLYEDLLHCRRVCKRWNLAVATEEWTSEANMQSSTSIPLIMRFRESSATDAALLALKPDNREWLRMDTGHALAGLRLYCEDGRKCSPCFRCTTVASLGLLILTCTCAVHWNSDPCVTIYNPVTMKLRRLIVPQLPAEYTIRSEGYFRLAGVIEGTNEKHYKLLFSTVYPKFIESFRVYCVYDSRNSSWTFGRGPIQDLPFLFSKASLGGCFYFLYRKVVYVHPRLIESPLFEPRMGKYDSDANVWSDIAWVPKHEGGEHLPQIVQCGGEVMFVALRRWPLPDPHTGRPYHTWCFFKLDQSATSVSKLWRCLVDYHGMPNKLLCSATAQQWDWATRLRQDFRCEGHGDKVIFYNVQPCTKYTVKQSSSSDSPGIPELKKNGILLQIDTKARKWRFLPTYYPFQKRDGSSVYKLEFFQPSFMKP